MHATRLAAVAITTLGVTGCLGKNGLGPGDEPPYEPKTPALISIVVEFPSGDRTFVVPDVEHSFGDHAPPPGTEFADAYTPGPGECSAATHDRYWVRAQDGNVYRTWHPASTTDIETEAPCNFGHEHGDDPRESPIYAWAGGVPFGITNRVATAGGHDRHEDHFGHKVVVQNLFEVAVGNGPSDLAITSAGFHCYWLSKVHQGTHSGDALRHNMHEYQNSVICDDGAARHPDGGHELNAGPANHTENSVKTLTFWGQPGWFKSCDGLTPLTTGDASDGLEPPQGSDTNREIKCATENAGWTFKEFPQAVAGTNGGEFNYEPFDGGTDELWKPWMVVVTRELQTIFTSSAYYVVRNPVRLYNDGSVVARRDVNGDGEIDNWIPTLEACLALGRDYGQCSDLPDFPSDVPQTEWWKLPQSPFNGTIRVIHPKRVDVKNTSSKREFCTDFLGYETEADPVPDQYNIPRCPAGQIFQRVAATNNLWVGNASWGPGNVRGDIAATMVNARGGIAAGYGHEWVRFFDLPGVHAPN